MAAFRVLALPGRIAGVDGLRVLAERNGNTVLVGEGATGDLIPGVEAGAV